MTRLGLLPRTRPGCLALCGRPCTAKSPRGTGGTDTASAPSAASCGDGLLVRDMVRVRSGLRLELEFGLRSGPGLTLVRSRVRVKG